MIVLVFISCRPVDLLSDDRLTYAYAAAFGCTSSFILQLILSVDTDSFNISPDVKPWIQSMLIFIDYDVHHMIVAYSTS